MLGPWCRLTSALPPPPPAKGDQPQNWRGTDPGTRHQPHKWAGRRLLLSLTVSSSTVTCRRSGRLHRWDDTGASGRRVFLKTSQGEKAHRDEQLAKSSNKRGTASTVKCRRPGRLPQTLGRSHVELGGAPPLGEKARGGRRTFSPTR